MMEMFRGFDILYLEGYLIINYDLTLRACSIAKSLGMKVALDLASYNVVEANKVQFEELIENYVDILFANEDEAKAITGQGAEDGCSNPFRKMFGGSGKNGQQRFFNQKRR